MSSKSSKGGHEVILPYGSKELREVLQKTNTDDPAKEDVKALRRALKEHPNMWRSVADMARITEGQIIDAAGGTALVKESLRHGVKEMRREMGYEEAPALERLLIDQVTLTWLHFHKTQHSYHQRTRDSIPISQADYWERRVNAAQRRYLRAVKTLARVRKMAGRAPLQINIAEQQVNVAG